MTHIAHPIIVLKAPKLLEPELKQIDDPALKSWPRTMTNIFLHNGNVAPVIHNMTHVIYIGWQTGKQTPGAAWWPLEGHLGINCAKERVRKRFYSCSIRSTVIKHVQLCKACNQKNSSLKSNTILLGHISVGKPSTFLAMDYIRSLPETSRENTHILVVVDRFTKWCEAFATPNQKASTVRHFRQF